MTLKEMKQQTFSLIEEYYPELAEMAEDNDVLLKINGVVNNIIMDLMPYRKISAVSEIEIDINDDKTFDLKNYINDLYQIKMIDCDKANILFDTMIQLPDEYTGTFKVYYYKYPELVELNPTDKNYDKSYEFELDNILLSIMPYGIAADLLKMDMISGYGKYFYERYLELKQQIDTRVTTGIIQIEGGIDL